jgi:predicted nucleotidyltransferase
LTGAASALAAIDSACKGVGVPFFLVGALARDILLHHLRGVARSPRLTLDVDVAVAVESWDHFEELRQELLNDYDFETSKMPHRLLAPGPIVVDLVPFGAVEDDRHYITLPPDDSFELSVVGFREALEMTETILLDGTDIRVIPLSAFGPLKLLAWSERRLQTTRDAEDFCFVLTSFWEAETERMLEDHVDLFEAEDGDNDFIGARAYGREAARFVARSVQLRTALMEILSRETVSIHESTLAVDMGQGCSYSYERRFEILERFTRGLNESLQ